MAQPCQLLFERARTFALTRALLVQPVRGDAEFALLVHFLGADLHFERTACRTDYRRVKRLVHVVLRHGDVVFEAAGHGVPYGVHGAQRRITVLDRRHDEAHRDEVVNLGKVLGFVRHLLIDGIQVLRTAHDLGVDADLFHLVLQDFDDFIQVRLAFGAAAGDHVGDLAVFRGLEVEERQVFEFPLDGIDAQAMGDGRVNLERFARFVDAPVFAQASERAHVVQAVSQLDYDDADVLAHGHEHLADGGGLLVGEVRDFDLGNLRDAFHQVGHVFAEALRDVVARDAGVFDGVVQQCGANGLGVHVQRAQNDGDLDRMRNERLARFALLTFMCRVGKREGVRQHVLLVVGEVTAR